MHDELEPNPTKPQSYIYRQASRVNISIKDIQHCLEFTSAWDASLSEALRRAVLTAVIISYARPFSENEEHPGATKTPPFSLKPLTQAEKHLHAHLLDVRKKAIAHSDFTKSSSRPFSFPDTGGVIMKTKMYDPLSEASKIPDIHALATKVKGLLTSTLHELAASQRRQGSN